MDSFELNKIAGAVIAALLIAFGSGTFLEVMKMGHHEEKAGYTLPVEIASVATGQPADEKKGFEFADVAKLMAAATPAAGEGVFKKCSNCHTVNEGGKNGQGPNLWEIVGRARASVDGFNYSKALQEKTGEWDYESLAGFLHKPKSWLKGTKMAFGGISSNQDLADLLVYLRSLSANPKPLPAAQ